MEVPHLCLLYLCADRFTGWRLQARDCGQPVPAEQGEDHGEALSRPVC
jgi:hypothetical protein